MTFNLKLVALISIVSLTACSGSDTVSGESSGGYQPTTSALGQRSEELDDPDRETIWDLFGGNDNPDTIVEVNKYLWAASLDVLNFLPIVAADPFTGIISTGYGTPPGGGRAYRATILIQDPALDARSLRVSLQSRSGPVSASTARAVEDAILARARQLRMRSSNI
jgi:hypothetical protein